MKTTVAVNRLMNTALSGAGLWRLPGEAVDGFAVVVLSGLGDGLGPFGVVNGIGVELGFQGHTAALAVVDAALAVGVQEVAGVELDAGTIRGNGHGSAGFRVIELGAGVAENLPVVVIAPLEVQRLVIGVNVPANGLGSAEIHRGAFHAALLPGGDAFGVSGGEEPAGEGENLCHGFFRAVVSRQVEIAVVGQVENRVLVADGVILNVKTAAAVQPVGHSDHGIPGEALITIGTAQLQGDGVAGMRSYAPHPGAVGIRAAVEVIAALIGGQGICFAAQNEAGTLDPVGAAANRSAEKPAAVQIPFAAVIAQNNICQVPLAVRYQKLDQAAAEIGDTGSHTAAGNCVQEAFLAGGQVAKRFFHGNLLSFLQVET